MREAEKETVAVEECSACGEGPMVHSRRDFVRDAMGAALAALATLGLAGRAEAVPIRWTRALERLGSRGSYPVPPADGVQIDRDNEVILVRWQGAVYAFALSCPHQRTALRWEEGAHQFQCPKHHSRYRPDGVFISGRATRSMDRYALRREGGQVAVDLSTLYKQTEHPAEWNAAFVRV